MQIKATMTFHPHLLEWLSSKNKIGIVMRMWIEALCTVGGNVNVYNHYSKIV